MSRALQGWVLGFCPCPAGCLDSRKTFIFHRTAALQSGRVGNGAPRNGSCLVTFFSTLFPSAFPPLCLFLGASLTRAPRGMAEATKTAKGIGPARVLWGGR